METKNPIQSAQRIFQVLEYIAANGPSGVVEIGNALTLHKSTVHRMLISLSSMGYVTQEEASGKYELTFKIVRMSSQFLAKNDMVSLAHPYLGHLANQCQETVHLVQRIGSDVVYIDKIEPTIQRDSSFKMVSRIGLVRPMYCSGVGKALLSGMTYEEVQSIWNNSRIEKKTVHTITSLEQMVSELEQIRKCGYSIDNEENEIGVRCIAAAINDFRGKAKYAFSISAPTSRMTSGRIEELSSFVLQTQKLLSEQFGGIVG